MPGVKEHSDLRALQGIGEVANCALERGLVEIERLDEFKAEFRRAAPMSATSSSRVRQLGGYR